MSSLILPPIRGRIADGNCYFLSFEEKEEGTKKFYTAKMFCQVDYYETVPTQKKTIFAFSPSMDITVFKDSTQKVTDYKFNFAQYGDDKTITTLNIQGDPVNYKILSVTPALIKITYDINNKNYIVKGLYPDIGGGNTINATIEMFDGYNITDTDIFASIPYNFSTIPLNEFSVSTDKINTSSYPSQPDFTSYYIQADQTGKTQITQDPNITSRSVFFIPLNYFQLQNQCVTRSPAPNPFSSPRDIIYILANWYYNNAEFKCSNNTFVSPNSKCVFTENDQCNLLYFYSYCIDESCGPCFGNCPATDTEPVSDKRCRLYFPITDGMSCSPAPLPPAPTPSPGQKTDTGNKYQKAGITTAIISASVVALILFLFYIFKN